MKRCKLSPLYSDAVSKNSVEKAQMAKQKSKGGACDTPLVTSVCHSASQKSQLSPSGYGIDYLSATIKTHSASDARDAIRAALKALKAIDTIGDEKQRHAFVGHDILGARGFCGLQKNTAFMELTGQGLAALRVMGNDDAKICATFKAWRASRLDFTVDSHSPKITPALVAREWHKGRATCRAEDIREITQKRADGRFSHTVYIGSNTSTRMLRVYDKKTQMEFVHLKKTDGTWTRFELQHRHEAADKALQVLNATGIQAGLQLINGWITFRDPKSRAKEVCRQKTAPWWMEIVGAKKQRWA